MASPWKIIVTRDNPWNKAVPDKKTAAHIIGQISEANRMKCLGTSEEVANVVLFLAFDSLRPLRGIQNFSPWAMNHTTALASTTPGSARQKGAMIAEAPSRRVPWIMGPIRLSRL